MAEPAPSILVVDDDEDTCRNVSDILTDLDYRVDTATDGPSALELVRKAPYDIALLDFKMPGMTGLELYREIRKVRSGTVAIIISAYTNAATREEAAKAGAWKVLSKPIDFPKLLGLVDEALGQPLMLVVDDDPDLCDNLWDLLREHGFRVCLAHDARAGAELAQERAYKVVLIDMRLPDGDGSYVYRAVRSAHPEARTVVITGLRGESETQVEQVVREGADAVCYKPFDVPALLATLDRLTKPGPPNRSEGRPLPFAILVVDDDADTRLNLCDILELDGYEVEAVGTGAEALARDDWGRYGAILLDRRLPDGTAEDLLPQFRRLAPDAAVMVVTGYADVAATIAAFRLGAADYILKPINADELRTRLRRIAEFHESREALRESQALNRSVLDSLSANIAVLDRDGTITAVNASWGEFARQHGGDAARCGGGANYFEVCRQATGRYGEEAAAVEHGLHAVLDGTVDRFTLEYPCAFLADKKWFTLIATPLGRDRRGVVVTHTDITERKRAEEALRERTEELRVTTQQLWQAARLAGVGELAASIAHELNNPLGTVSLRVEGVLAKTATDDPRRHALEVVSQEVERMARLVANLLNFSRAEVDKVSTVDVCEEVTQALDLIEHHLRKHQIRAEPSFAPDVPAIYADRQQLRQVLLNLFTNAADAMPNGGRLTPRVRTGELVGGRPAVVIEVTDTGVGIPPHLIARLTEPFFTTKPEGKGTGLGLAICKRIASQHQGTIEVESRLGEGTTVRVTLPVRPDTNAADLHTV